MTAKKIKYTLSTGLLTILLGLAAVLIQSCKKDSLFQEIVTTPKETVNTIVSGQVIDEYNKPVSQARIIAEGQVVFTNEHGLFAITNLKAPKSRCYVRSEKTGYFNASRTLIPVKDGVTTFRLVMMSNANTHLIGIGGGTVITGDGAMVNLPPNAAVSSDGNAYTGTIHVAVRHLDPDNKNFGDLVPGDMEAIRTDHSFVVLKSYGVLNVELRDDKGKLLQLAPGKEATLTMPVPASMVSSAPNTIPLWYFDEAKGYWIEEGQAVRDGNFYVGKVRHFTPWNCDKPYPPNYLKGRVTECDLLPLAGVVVTIDGSAKVTTDANGYFYVKVVPNEPATIEVRKEDNFGVLWSASKTVTAGNSNDTTDAGTFEVICPSRVTGALVDCNGLPISGHIFISWDDGSNYSYTTTGAFAIPVAPNKSAILFAYGSNGKTVSDTIQTLNSPLVLDMGGVKVCETTVPDDNYIILNGDGFFNKKMFLDTTTAVIYLKIEADTSTFQIKTIDTAAVINIHCKFPGIIEGKYPIKEPYDFQIWQTGGNFKNYLAKDVTITVKKMPAKKGDLFEADFEGTLFDNINQNTVILIQGKCKYTMK